MTQRYSLAEIDAQCRKAARGAGYAWGIAEEAGKAVRWLASFGLPGPEALVVLLMNERSTGTNDASELMCPLTYGASLSDLAHAYNIEDMLPTQPIASPLLLLPQLTHIAKVSNASISLSWQGFCAVITTQDDCFIGGESALAVSALVEFKPSDMATNLQHRSPQSYPVRPETWETLAQFAAKTYAPATEASRMAGAGAGVSDND